VDTLSVASKRTVLIVECNPIIRKLLQVTLERGDLAVLMARSGKDAMLREVSFSGPIDLLLSEMMMPDIMGPELASAMKERRPDMRVMLMSHSPDCGMVLLNYCRHFIRRIFLPIVLLAKVNQVLVDTALDQIATENHA
jgi:two-component system cell cycle sensor histidine kinase/response regulator CckA